MTVEFSFVLDHENAEKEEQEIKMESNHCQFHPLLQLKKRENKMVARSSSNSKQMKQELQEKLTMLKREEGCSSSG